MTAAFPKEGWGWMDSDWCWCQKGRQSREHLFKERITRRKEIRALWRGIRQQGCGKQTGLGAGAGKKE